MKYYKNLVKYTFPCGCRKLVTNTVQEFANTYKVDCPDCNTK